MKRIRYVSRFGGALLPGGIEALAREAAEHNRQNDITGMLLATGDLFFQIIEGPRLAVDALFNRIESDPRHTDVLVLSVEVGSLTRLCPDWSMKGVDLSLDATDRMAPLKALLNVVIEQHRVMTMAREALERSAWNLFVQAELDELHKTGG